MTSGPIVVQVLEGENAVKTYRDVMGATDPAKADAGTIRKELAESIERNSVHGSDSAENAPDRDRAQFQAGGDRRLKPARPRSLPFARSVAMITPDYVRTMAGYNRWQNENLYGAADS